MKLKLPLLFSLTYFLAGCALVEPAARSNQTPTLTVFTAASLTEAFTAIGKQFEAARPNTRVLFNFAGSQQLAQQIAQGAPADVFASADQQQMQVVIQSGRVDARAPKIFAANRLVVIVPRANPAGITGLSDLTKPGVQIVLADAAVPVGSYSLEFLNNASQQLEFGESYRDQVLENIVSYEENVRVVLSKVSLGEADAGIVYISDLAAANTNAISVLEIPGSLNVAASYLIAPVADSPQAALAGDFVDFVLSSSGQDILAQYGLAPVQ
jgi:molybdate transport system substrate-binding protein